MERTGSVRAIQGGGNGSGFRAPRQILRYDAAQFMRIARPLVALSGSKYDIAQETQDTLMRVWGKELSERIFFIYQRKNDELKESRSCRCVRNPQSDRNDMEIAQNGSNSTRPCEEQATSEASAGDGEQENQVVSRPFREMLPDPVNAEFCFAKAQLEQCYPKKRRIDGQFSVEKIVPGLPKTMDELVQLWRNGSLDRKISPLHILVDVSSRKKAIPGYTNKIWNLSGQKRAFNRLKALVKLVAREKELSIRDIGLDSEWEEALNQFHAKWSDDGRGKPLSYVLKNANSLSNQPQ